jgi:hypothetical protein
VGNTLLNIFFMQLSKREMHPHIVRLPFPICEARLVNARVSLLLVQHGLEV